MDGSSIFLLMGNISDQNFFVFVYFSFLADLYVCSTYGRYIAIIRKLIHVNSNVCKDMTTLNVSGNLFSDHWSLSQSLDHNYV